jgi:hypothetical protein
MKSLKEVGGVHLRGQVAELWAHGCKAGLVFDWTFDGWQADWQLAGERYKLDPLIIGDGHRAVRVKVEVGPGRLEAPGTIWTDCVADGKSHRAIIIKGGQLQWQKKRAALALVSRD